MFIFNEFECKSVNPCREANNENGRRCYTTSDKNKKNNGNSFWSSSCLFNASTVRFSFSLDDELLNIPLLLALSKLTLIKSSSSSDEQQQHYCSTHDTLPIDQIPIAIAVHCLESISKSGLSVSHILNVSDINQSFVHLSALDCLSVVCPMVTSFLFLHSVSTFPHPLCQFAIPLSISFNNSMASVVVVLLSCLCRLLDALDLPMFPKYKAAMSSKLAPNNEYSVRVSIYQATAEENNNSNSDPSLMNSLSKDRFLHLLNCLLTLCENELRDDPAVAEEALQSCLLVYRSVLFILVSNFLYSSIPQLNFNKQTSPVKSPLIVSLSKRLVPLNH